MPFTSFSRTSHTHPKDVNIRCAENTALAQLGDGPSPGLAPGTCQPVAGTRLDSPKRVAVTKRENRFFLTLVGSLFSRRRNLGGRSLADLVISETEEVTQELGEHGLGAA